ncbi:glycosyl hydrolase [Micromonospora sp. NBC_00421]|uniref:glycosyl hydrolase n=1 Tax=Micromonospora sp. NBC_00421 TaxID=2975976 RepID=UPI002E230143
MRWRIMLATAMVAASGGAALLGAGTASAAVGSPLVSAASGRCLDVSGNSPTAGTPVAIWDCNGQQNQGWVSTSQGELRTFNETRCLDLASATAGSPLTIQNCTGQTNQKFRWNTNGSITATQSGLCLDVEGNNSANGTRVVLWSCNGQSNQRWSQSGGPSTPPTTPPTTCTVAPVDPQATTQARKLLCYLYSQYGNHILSGQRETNGSEAEFNHILTNTGKQPAIRGLDMCDRPGAVDRALAWWNAGGIPLIGWHVGAPATSSCNYGGTASINATLTPGTAENRSYLAELDAAAAQLQRLQSNGVAVLWAPYHEAGGTWFWWSKEGGSQYQRLWRFQFDYFTRTKGIHNLVWLHPYNGEPNSSFYPGKQYVDIGGADTYANDHGPLTSLFNRTRDIVGGTVPIALHENGPIPDPDQLQSTGSRWVLFSTWNGSWLTERNDVTFLRRVYGHSYVVTRDEVPNLR